MSNDSLGLVNSLDIDLQKQLVGGATKTYRDKPDLKEQFHVLMSSPVLGTVRQSYPDVSSMRNDIAKALPQLTQGKIYVIYGVELPIYTDGSGAHLYVTNKDGEELCLTDSANVRKHLNNNEFGYNPITCNLDELV